MECPYAQSCFRFATSEEGLRIPSESLPESEAQCTCIRCRRARDEQRFRTRKGPGDRRYAVPVGWTLFPLPPRDDTPVEGELENWPIAYVGAISRVASRIASVPDSRIPFFGETLAKDSESDAEVVHGITEHFVGGEIPTPFLIASPSLVYVSMPVFAPRTSFEGSKFVTAFRVRVRRTSFTERTESILDEGEKPFVLIDRLFPNFQIEWRIENPHHVVVTHLMIRKYGRVVIETPSRTEGRELEEDEGEIELSDDSDIEEEEGEVRSAVPKIADDDLDELEEEGEVDLLRPASEEVGEQEQEPEDLPLMEPPPPRTERLIRDVERRESEQAKRDGLERLKRMRHQRQPVSGGGYWAPFVEKLLDSHFVWNAAIHAKNGSNLCRSAGWEIERSECLKLERSLQNPERLQRRGFDLSGEHYAVTEVEDNVVVGIGGVFEMQLAVVAFKTQNLWLFGQCVGMGDLPQCRVWMMKIGEYVKESGY